MSRYIDADALIKWINGTGCFMDVFKRVTTNIINKQPTVDAVQVVHSSWSVFAEMDLLEGRTGKHILVCRECGHTEKIHHSDKMPNYCQNCGAKMDGERKEKTDEQED